MNSLEMLVTGPVNMWASMAGNETNKRRRRRPRSEVQRMVRELLLAGLAGKVLNNKTQGGRGPSWVRKKKDRKQRRKRSRREVDLLIGNLVKIQNHEKVSAMYACMHVS